MGRKHKDTLPHQRKKCPDFVTNELCEIIEEWHKREKEGTMHRPDFGDLIRKKRREKNLTLKQLAQKLTECGSPISTSWLWSLENEWIVPKIDIIFGLMEVLDISTEDVHLSLRIDISEKKRLERKRAQA